jgi:hypothetical protein
VAQNQFDAPQFIQRPTAGIEITGELIAELHDDMPLCRYKLIPLASL